MPGTQTLLVTTLGTLLKLAYVFLGITVHTDWRKLLSLPFRRRQRRWRGRPESAALEVKLEREVLVATLAPRLVLLALVVRTPPQTVTATSTTLGAYDRADSPSATQALNQAADDNSTFLRGVWQSEYDVTLIP